MAGQAVRRRDRRRAGPRPVLALAVGCIGVLAAGEAVHWWASRSGLGATGAAPADSGSGEAVVVLGHSDAGARAGRQNRARVRAGLRSRSGADSVLVLAGGAVAGPVPEAELMGRYLRDELGYRGPVVLETVSRSTWENIERVIPLVEGAGRIKVVSDSVHALKARRYLKDLRPDLAARLVRGADYLPGERVLVKPALALNGLIDLALARWVPGWTRWSTPGLAGLRRLAAAGGSWRRSSLVPAPGGRGVL